MSPIIENVSLYAEDTLYLKEADSSLSLLDQFREFSGIRVKKDKSVLFSLSLGTPPSTHQFTTLVGDPI